MENIIISKNCCLCSGCKHAINLALQAKNQYKDVVLFKEIVHNKNVNSLLESHGVKTINNIEEIDENDFVILRAHGEPPSTYEYLNSHNIKYDDCTCVNVKKIHDLVKEYSEQNYTIIIVGKYGKTTNKQHPEISGTIGWCKKSPILIEDEEDVSKLNSISNEKLYLLCQTTFNESLADKIIDKIKVVCEQNKNEIIINKTICGAQKLINISSVELAKNCDIMIVVGGKNSSNSLELFNNVKQFTNSIFIEDVTTWYDEIKSNNYDFKSTTKVGLTAGASTMKEELDKLKDLITKKQEELKYEN